MDSASLLPPAAIPMLRGRTSKARRLRHDDRSGGREGAPRFGLHRYEEGYGRARDAGAGGAEEGSLLGPPVCVPRQESLDAEDPVLGWQRPLSIYQAYRSRQLCLADDGRL